MNTDTDKLGQLLAKQAITEIIYQYCRGLDRMDKALTLACWHPDGTCDYGNLWTGKAADWVEWVWPIHESVERTSHTVQNILIELDGNEAAAESYFVAWLRNQEDDGPVDIIFAGRYLDNFECRDGAWKFRHRRAVYDWDHLQKVTTHYDNLPHIDPSQPGCVSPRGLRNRKDCSYEVFKGIYG